MINMKNRLKHLKKIESDTDAPEPMLKMDEKDFGIGAQILHDLKINKIKYYWRDNNN